MWDVVIGMDPHRRSATIEVVISWEPVVATTRFGTDRAGYQVMRAVGRKYPDRVWAVEGGTGVGRHLTQRRVADGEPGVDVPAKLSARARVFFTGHGRKSDPVDAHSVAPTAASVKPRLWSDHDAMAVGTPVRASRSHSAAP